MLETETKPVSKIVEFLRTKIGVPDAAVVLGSGVNVLENLEEETSLSYKEVFGISPSVAGHAGSLTCGRIGNKRVAVLRGRFHLYEGHDWDVVTLPTRVLIELGVPQLFVTNAAGGLNLSFKVGDLMLITHYRDGLNPRWRKEGLIPAIKSGPVNCENDLTNKLWQGAESLSKEPGFRRLQKGTYIGLLGPSYETMAEIDMLKHLQIHAVGMSTVPELQTVAGTKTNAAAISVITNVWTPDVVLEGHKEVLEAAQEASQRLDRLLRAAILN